MRGLNKVTLIGNLGGDPDFQQLESGPPGGNVSVAKFSLATTESFKDKNGKVQFKSSDAIGWGNAVRQFLPNFGGAELAIGLPKLGKNHEKKTSPIGDWQNLFFILAGESMGVLFLPTQLRGTGGLPQYLSVSLNTNRNEKTLQTY